MKERDFRFIIGIDLGTTNSAVSYVDTIEGVDASIKRFYIPQATRKGEFNPHNVLPSFLYIPGKFELSKEDIKHPWNKRVDDFAGVFARDHGSKIPARLISSAKSWLCHDKIDKNSKILPWGSQDGVEKRSPVEATAEYLIHIKNAWNIDKKQDDRLYFENQFITITIPASFDEVARKLTLDACKKAGLGDVVLLEEPLAAFYSWLITKENNWDKYVKKDELILVCDVGGGTTDFTLIALRDVDGASRFDRIAVGDHLILGGDNIDLAIARLAESKINSKKSLLKGDKWKTLCHLSRQAKEKILEGESDKERITIIGDGSKLIKGTISVDLEKEEIENIVLNGFFPKVLRKDLKKDDKAKKGITEFGLPYESDPAITKHLIDFLFKHKEDVKRITGKQEPLPDYILFNGGSLKPKIIQDSIRKSIRDIFNIDDEDYPKVLDNPKPDSAVSIGAAYYGKVKQGVGVKVGSGSPRSYYLGMETKEGKKGALCLIERGLEEGSVINLPKEYSFLVKANQPVSFDIYSSSYRANDKCGDFIECIDDSFSFLPPMQTIINYGKKGDQLNISIDLNGVYTETGSLAIWCDSKESQHKWDLSFDLRSSVGVKEEVLIKSTDTLESKEINQCIELVKNAFEGEKDDVKSIVKDLTKKLERSKNNWPLMLIRKISDYLIANNQLRLKSPIHEARWLNLTGFCLRPGIGDPMDEVRIKKLWAIYSKGLNFENDIQNKNEWWVLWRRVAAGLKPGYQRQIIQDLSSIIKKNKAAPQEKSELWSAIGNFEYLHSNDKKRFGNILKNELKPGKSESKMVSVLGRLGAREPLYGDIDKVVPPETVLKWLKFYMTKKWANVPEAVFSISQMARLTGDRIRDLDKDKRDEVINFLTSIGHGDKTDSIKEIVEVKEKEEKQRFGESLPSGIVLHK